MDMEIEGLEAGEYSLDHIGIAVESLSRGFEFYKNLGFTKISEEVVESEKVKVGMIELKNSCRIELLEPLSEESPVQKFLEKRGSGIHHICLRVKGLDKVVEKLKKTDVQLINEKPRRGAHQTQVVFIHPKSTGGVLVELSEKMGQNMG